MEMDPNPPSFNIQAQVPTRDIGAGYAAGIAQAGQSLSDATKGVMDVMQRNQNADDVLGAMTKGGMITPDIAKLLAGKSIGAKEQMLGMYANQWMLDQANQRALSLARGQGGVEVATQHAKMLDMINTYRQQYGGAAAIPGMDPSKMPWVPGQPAQPGSTQPVQQQPQQQPKPAAPAPALPGTRYVQRTDPSTGKQQTGTLYPSGQFIADPGQ